MRAEELLYDLPPALIAQEPAPQREAARLLVMDRGREGVEHASVLDLPQLLPPALFVFNDTKVIPARLVGTKPSGGRFELLLVERLSEGASEQRWLCMGKPMKSLRGTLRVGALAIEVGPRREELLEVTLRAPDVEAALDQAGQMPLPPYIARQPVRADRDRYQTVFAREPGAVAAPTAGLHFGETLLAGLEAAGHQRAFVTLHVGPGTFTPLSVDDLREHPMHAEHYQISVETAAQIAEARRTGRPVVAVGTTVVRTLEASLRKHGVVTAGVDATNVFLYPPQEIRAVDTLVTNFHLPRSTLLALVMAFAGIEPTRLAYREAVAQQYRFFSYGDAMLIRGKT
ncbi:MAG TPA: tRNA preQ1(34) S-adenosylmethionine ribosyltransferase-isomerase QueA [Polyangiales bacterium]|nr:tRNA preQ1(34) S-adenosylmethionine ribosyltransferase-isomerase QueA [Polyangiales bacterium]